jgi:hypothetical protein
LREKNKRNGAVTGVEENGIRGCDKKKISGFRSFQVFKKEIETQHGEKHKKSIGTAFLRETDMIGHEG